ncbi:MAG: lytic murein transglycosylase B [Gammaproteobacteria bacterium]
MTRTRPHSALKIQICAAALLLALSFPGFALDTGRDDVNAFVNELVDEYQFDRTWLESTLGDGETKQKILEAMSRPAEKTLAWHEYRKIFVTPKRIDAGVKFWKEHGDRLARISAETGVPPEIMAAIVGVETYYGRLTGGYRVLDALATLGFDYPPRAKFFRGELKEFFLLTRDEQLELKDVMGSYAGAMGPPQFIPSSYRAYAVDGDGDGRRDLLGNWDDILASVANYFVEHGWRAGEPVAVPGKVDDPQGFPPVGKNKLKLNETVESLAAKGVRFDTDLNSSAPTQLIGFDGDDGDEYWVGFKNFYVITRYNRSAMYAMAVYQLSAELAKATGNAAVAASAADVSAP